MSPSPRGNAVDAAIALIEEQLRTIPLSVALVLHGPKLGSTEIADIARSLQLPRKGQSAKSGSVGNIIVAETRSNLALDLQAVYAPLQDDQTLQHNYLRVIIGNALLAVEAFLDKQDITRMRTPEIQFMNHVCNALLNGNRFTIAPGVIPIATFDGLRIDASLNGSSLFGNEYEAGFMELGDAVALLQWLALYLRGGQHFETAGDAG